MLLHSLSHALITEIALDCSGQLVERARVCAQLQFVRSPGSCGILVYTATAGAQGTLGGLVATYSRFGQILRAALARSAICSKDTVCADNEPDDRIGDRATHRMFRGHRLAAPVGCSVPGLGLDSWVQTNPTEPSRTLSNSRCVRLIEL